MSEPSDQTATTTVDAQKDAYGTKRVSEFVYGVTSAMIAIAGLIETSYSESGWAAAAVVVSGAAAIWLAHSYADWLGEHVRAKGGHGFSGILLSLRASWPIVLAGLLLAVPAALSETGAWSVAVGLTLGNVIGIVMLFGLGLAAARLSQANAIRTVGMTLLTVGIGVAVIAIEQTVHHLA